MQHLSDAKETQIAGKTYLWWFLPNMALQFAMTVMMAALRGTGVVKPTMIVQLIAVILNIILAPILISGWLTGIPLGVAGAGLASTIAAIAGFIMLAVYFRKSSRFLKIKLKNITPQWHQWQRIMTIGFPSGAEFVLMFAYVSIVYWALQKFGPHAQAGFGIGNRIMQSLMMPTLAISFATPALIGQNFGAGKATRVKEILSTVLKMNLFLMMAFGAICIFAGEHMMKWFTHEDGIIAIGGIYLTWIGWNYIPSSVIMGCNGAYQGLGNTWPALFCSAIRIIFVLVGIWFIYPMDWFLSEHIWQLSLVATTLQAGLAYFFLQRLMDQKLQAIPTN
jgi:putative MATE family efflux protein